MSFKTAVVISANQEWQVLLTHFYPNTKLQSSPLGEWFTVDIELENHPEPVVFFHGGWGKVAAAASAQYVLDRWSPKLLINLGTCGGFEGAIEKGTIILVERTIVYDIFNQMGSSEGAIVHYSTDIDLSWLNEPLPQVVLRALLVSGDRDLMVEDIPRLKAEYGAVAGDWESGAIAWVAARNDTRCLILRGVSDLVSSSGGEAYGDDLQVFIEGTRQVFEKLLPRLSQWIALSSP